MRFFQCLLLVHAQSTRRTPSPRYGHCSFAIYERMFILGGETLQGTLSDELFDFSPHNASWSWSIIPGGPPGIEGHACNVVNNRAMLVTGGNTANGPSNQIWVLQFDQGLPAKWSKGPEMPEAVRWHTATLHGPHPEVGLTTTLVLYGGSLGRSCQENLTDAVISISVADSLGGFKGQWQAQNTTGASPGPQMGHVTVNDPRGPPFLYVIGGQTDNYCKQSGFKNDVHALNIESWQWTSISPVGTPPTKCYGHTAWYSPYAGGSVQLTGGTCGAACGSIHHT